MPDYKNYNKDRSKKICVLCQNMLDVDLFRTREKKTGRGKGKFLSNACRKCEQQKVSDYRNTPRGIAAEVVRRTKHKSKVLNLPFDLDKNWVFNRLQNINWCCELTNLPMKRYQSKEGKNCGFMWDSLSVDRINPKGGYTKDNVRFILNQINVFRQDSPDEQMYMLAKALLEYRKENE